jgi:NADPH:quinone reductase-like Zn-dependent oxidoreductase
MLKRMPYKWRSKLGFHVVASASSADLDYVRSLGAETVVDYKHQRFEDYVTGVDAVLDTVGGDTQQRSLQVLTPGGILVSLVSPVSEEVQRRFGIRAAYCYVDVTMARLKKITELFDSGRIATAVGTVAAHWKKRALFMSCLPVLRENAERLC